MGIILKNISKSFDGRKIIDAFSAEFHEASLYCLMGPSGCGKSTVLNIVAGLVRPDSGSVELSVRGKSAPSMAYAFQEPRLLPWKSVSGNVELVLSQDLTAEERRKKAIEKLSLVEMEEYADETPAKLSGGMAQRVSLARALAAEADILLLDEAFSALDAELKGRIIKRLKALWKENGTTVLMVSHNGEEAGLCSAGIIRLQSQK